MCMQRQEAWEAAVEGGRVGGGGGGGRGEGGGGGEPAVVKREGARSEELLDHHYCTSAAVSNCSHPRQLSTDRRLVSTCLNRPLLFNKLDQLRKSQKDKTWKCE